MKQVGLDFFLIEVRPKRTSHKLPLDNIDGKNGNILNIFDDALNPVSKKPEDNKAGSYVSLKGLKKDVKTVSGLFQIGEYGYAGDVVNRKTHKADYKKTKDHADLVPMYFYLYAYPGADRAILSTQRMGMHGVSSTINQYVKDYFEKKYPNLKLDIKALVPDYVLKQYLGKGQVKSITFVKHAIPSDYSDQVANRKSEQEGKIELKISAKDSKFFQAPKLLRALQKKESVLDFYSIDAFEADDVKASVEIDGNKRTINLTNWSNLRTRFDITDQVEEDLNGYPKPADVRKAMSDIIKDIAPAAGIKL